jgi:isoleucyl-tRNA synthetase
LQQEIIEAYEGFQFHLVYQKAHAFCSLDLGSFYLDVLKDRQYTCQENSVARRSAQTAMFHIAEALVRWLAPITSFTADEIWRHLPGKRSPSVFVETWYQGLTPLASDAPLNRDFWDQLLKLREAVSRELEILRVRGEIGSSLDAEVESYVEGDTLETLGQLGDELRFVLLTSYACVLPRSEARGETLPTDIPGVELRVFPSQHPKCVRCWHHRHDVGSDAEHPDLCGRCVENVAGSGESRRFA